MPISYWHYSNSCYDFCYRGMLKELLKIKKECVDAVDSLKRRTREEAPNRHRHIPRSTIPRGTEHRRKLGDRPVPKLQVRRQQQVREPVLAGRNSRPLSKGSAATVAGSYSWARPWHLRPPRKVLPWWLSLCCFANLKLCILSPCTFHAFFPDVKFQALTVFAFVACKCCRVEKSETRTRRIYKLLTRFFKVEFVVHFCIICGCIAS